MRTPALLLVLALLILGCDDASGPAEIPHVASQYILTGEQGTLYPVNSPNGVRGGEISLTVDGIAVRRVFGLNGSSDRRIEDVSIGTYRVVGDEIFFRLRPRNDQQRVWTPAATLRSGMIRLSYPNPADGPDIVEEYVDTDHILYSN